MCRPAMVSRLRFAVLNDVMFGFFSFCSLARQATMVSYRRHQYQRQRRERQRFELFNRAEPKRFLRAAFRGAEERPPPPKERLAWLGRGGGGG